MKLISFGRVPIGQTFRFSRTTFDGDMIGDIPDEYLFMKVSPQKYICVESEEGVAVDEITPDDWFDLWEEDSKGITYAVQRSYSREVWYGND